MVRSSTRVSHWQNALPYVAGAAMENAGPPPTLVPHVLAPIVDADYELAPDSLLQARAVAVIEHFDVPLPVSNPRLLDMFADRNRKSNGQTLGQMAWAGEFVGKWLTHAAQLYRLTKHPELRATVSMALGSLAKNQASDGYLGPFPDARGTDGLRTMSVGWDAWGHYHIMLGCLLWHDADPAMEHCVAIATKIASVMTTTFPGADPKKFFAQGSLEQNMAILDSMALLYCSSGDPKLLTFCQMVVAELQIPPAGDYIRNALKGQAFYKGSQPRWEALCGICGFAVLYHATGQQDLSTAYQQIWWSLCEYERHNQGGMMSGEQARGDPYNTASEETCCTVTWGAMCVEMLKLTGNSVVADELELSLLNSGLFLLSPSGRWCVYNSMMDGVRSSTMMEISFQCKPGSSELSCCSVNGPRMIGLLSEYAVMRLDSGSHAAGFAINLFAAGTTTVSTPKGDGHIVFTQETDYPLGDGTVNLTVSPSARSAVTFTLWLRIPCWSAKTTVTVAGAAVPANQIIAGKYLPIQRAWSNGDKVEIQLDFRLRIWEQILLPETEAHQFEKQCQLCASIGAPPKPVWSSGQDAKWDINGVVMGSDPGSVHTITVPPKSGSQPVNAGPTTGMAWIAPHFMSATGMGGDMIPFSFGANTGTGKGSDDCRALAITSGGSNADYYARKTGDIYSIISTAAGPTWSHAMKDQAWHHVAVTDDGSTFSVWLDGRVTGTGKHSIPPKTAGGFVIGDWADLNRAYCGNIAGVQFFDSVLQSADLIAAMAATKPTTPPPPQEFVMCSLYRGPLLLGFDPSFNPTVDAMLPLDGTKLSYTEAQDDSWLPPNCLYEFTAADTKQTKVRLADYGSLGLRGQVSLLDNPFKTVYCKPFVIIVILLMIGLI